MIEKIVIRGPSAKQTDPDELAAAVARAAVDAAIQRTLDDADDAPQEDEPVGLRLHIEPEGEVSARVAALLSKDEAYTRLELPSNFLSYPWKTIGVKPLRGVHQAKIANAARQMSTRLLVECINTLLPPEVNAFDLTTPDFQWLLYWLRQHGYTKVPLQVRAICKNPKHVDQVESGELDGKTLVNIADVNRSILEETGFIEEQVRETLALIDSIENIPLTLDRIGDVCDLLDMITKINDTAGKNPKAVDDAELLGHIGSLAAVYDLRTEDGKRASMADRIKAVEELPIEDYLALEQAARHLLNYGISETARVTCKECGAEIRESIRISAQSFLPDHPPAARK